MQNLENPSKLVTSMAKKNWFFGIFSNGDPAERRKYFKKPFDF